MELKDLKPEDYYYAEYKDENEKYVIAKGIKGPRPILFISRKSNDYWGKNYPHADKNIRLATPEEKHWLDCCILANKYVKYEEAMKHYVEPIVVNKKFIKDPELDEILIKLLNL